MKRSYVDFVNLPELVERANRFEAQATRSLESMMLEMEQERDTAEWPERFLHLARLEREALRCRAAHTLGERAQEPLVRALIHELAESGDEGNAVLGLRALGDVELPSEEDLAPLAASLASPDDSTAAAASISLGRLSRTSSRARDLLLEAARDGLPDQALPGLAQLCDRDDGALELVRQALMAPRQNRRLAAGQALLYAHAIPEPLLEMLEDGTADPCREMRNVALACLARASSRSQKATEFLFELASDEAHPMRLRAVHALAQAAPTSPQAEQALETMFEGASSSQLVAMAMGLASVAADHLEGCLPLLARIDKNGDPEAVAVAAEALAAVAASRHDGPVEVVYGMLGQGVGPDFLYHLAEAGADSGTLARRLLTLWEGGGDPVAHLAALRDTLQALQQNESALPETYHLLEELTHFATIDEILASAADLRLAATAIRAGRAHLAQPLELLFGWVDSLARFENEPDPESQSRIVKAALADLEGLKERFTAGNLPEGSLLAHLAGRWRSVVLQTLFSARRGADIVLRVVDRELEPGGQGRLAVEVRNRGPGVAYDIGVELCPSPHCTVQVGTQRIPSLSPDQAQVVDFSLTPTSLDLERFRVELKADYSDFAETGRSVRTAEEVACRRSRPFSLITNPYIPGLPLELGSNLFLGRDDVFAFVKQNLRQDSQKRCLVLVGQRRMGKTSILKQLPVRLSADFLPVLVDCQGLEHHGLANLLLHLAHIIGDALRAEGVPHTIPELSGLEARPRFTFEYNFIKPVVEALGSRTMLLAIDEFQALEDAVEAGDLDVAVFGFFRSLMQHQDRLFFLFSGLQGVAESRDYWQPVFNVALRHEVGLLEEAYAIELITKPVAREVLYDPLALKHLMELCSGHPYLTQLFCDRLINHLNETRDNQVRPHTIQEVMPQVFAAGVNHFYSLWEDLCPREKIVLISLSSGLSQHRYATLSAITRFIRERGIHAELEEVNTALQQLLTHDMVEYVNAQPPGYAFRVNLFRYWIENEMLQTLVGGRLQWD